MKWLSALLAAASAAPSGKQLDLINKVKELLDTATTELSDQQAEYEAFKCEKEAKITSNKATMDTNPAIIEGLEEENAIKRAEINKLSSDVADLRKKKKELLEEWKRERAIPWIGHDGATGACTASGDSLFDCTLAADMDQALCRTEMETLSQAFTTNSADYTNGCTENGERYTGKRFQLLQTIAQAEATVEQLTVALKVLTKQSSLFLQTSEVGAHVDSIRRIPDAVVAAGMKEGQISLLQTKTKGSGAVIGALNAIKREAQNTINASRKELDMGDTAYVAYEKVANESFTEWQSQDDTKSGEIGTKSGEVATNTNLITQRTNELNLATTAFNEATENLRKQTDFYNEIERNSQEMIRACNAAIDLLSSEEAGKLLNGEAVTFERGSAQDANGINTSDRSRTDATEWKADDVAQEGIPEASFLQVIPPHKQFGVFDTLIDAIVELRKDRKNDLASKTAESAECEAMLKHNTDKLNTLKSNYAETASTLEESTDSLDKTETNISDLQTATATKKTELKATQDYIDRARTDLSKLKGEYVKEKALLKQVVAVLKKYKGTQLAGSDYTAAQTRADKNGAHASVDTLTSGNEANGMGKVVKIFIDELAGLKTKFDEEESHLNTMLENANDDKKTVLDALKAQASLMEELSKQRAHWTKTSSKATKEESRLIGLITTRSANDKSAAHVANMTVEAVSWDTNGAVEANNGTRKVDISFEADNGDGPLYACVGIVRDFEEREWNAANGTGSGQQYSKLWYETQIDHLATAEETVRRIQETTNAKAVYG